MPSPVQPLMSMPVDELRQRARTPFELLPDIPALLKHFARSIATEIVRRNARGAPTRLILPVGPVQHYPRLAEMANRERINWKNVWTFQMDEFLDWQGRPVPVEHPLSFEGFLRRELFGRIDEELRSPASQHCVPDPFRIGEISEKIQRAGGVDVCYGGIGYHGHVAFNEPPLSRWREVTEDEFRESLTRVVTLGSDSVVIQSIGCAGGDPEAIPPMAVTLGMKDILASRKIRLYLAGGERHRAIFRRAVAGEPSVRYPATLVQGHADAMIYTDEATARPIRVGLM